jgi:hypothetical protein
MLHLLRGREGSRPQLLLRAGQLLTAGDSRPCHTAVTTYASTTLAWAAESRK